jgi:hypothetical protein
VHVEDRSGAGVATGYLAAKWPGVSFHALVWIFALGETICKSHSLSK